MKIGEEQSQILTAALDGMPNGLAIYDMEGNLLMCNKRYETFLQDYCHVEDGNLLKAGLPEEFAEAIERQGHYAFLMYFDKDNNPQPCYSHGPVNRVHASAVIVDNEMRGYSIAVADATEEVKREYQLQIYKRNSEFVLDHMSCGLVYLAPDYKVMWKGIDKIYGPELASKMYVEGTYCYQHFGLTEPCQDCPVTWAMRDKEDKHRVFHDPGNNTDLDVKVLVMKEKDVIQGYLMELRDITQQVQAISQLEEARNKAKEGERAKSAFINTMSHEFRTPLNALLGFSKILCNPDAKELNEEERKLYAEVIQHNADLLTNMVNDMLVISDLDTGKYHMQMQEIELKELLHISVLSVTERLKEGVELSIKLADDLQDATLMTDQSHLSQALHHMLTNAVKHTTQGSIVLSVECKEMAHSQDEQQQLLEFSVTDTGSGIPEDKREEIFKPFVKLDHFKTGTGLGLSICTQIAQLLGGEFRLDTEYKEGARFIFTHPYTNKSDTLSVTDVK